MLYTPELYAAVSYWSMLHSTELFLSYDAPCELHCTLWATLHPTEPSFLLPRYTETLLSYPAPSWATPLNSHPTELCYNLFNYAAPTDQYCTSQSYAALIDLCCTSHSYAAPHWATLYPTELSNTLWITLHPTQLLNTLWATLYPTELCCTHWAILYPTELPCTLQSYPTTCELCCTLLCYAVPHSSMVQQLQYNEWEDER
jgi:hypothetical protein